MFRILLKIKVVILYYSRRTNSASAQPSAVKIKVYNRHSDTITIIVFNYYISLTLLHVSLYYTFYPKYL